MQPNQYLRSNSAIAMNMFAVVIQSTSGTSVTASCQTPRLKALAQSRRTRARLRSPLATPVDLPCLDHFAIRPRAHYAAPTAEEKECATEARRHREKTR